MSTTRPLALACLLIFSGCAAKQKFNPASIETITLKVFEADPQKYAPPWSDSERGYILHVPAGEKLPLSLEIETPFATVETGKNSVVFQKDVYIYMTAKAFKVSPDRLRWADVGNWKAVKKIFGIEKGLFAVGMGVSKEQGALMSLAIKAERK